MNYLEAVQVAGSVILAMPGLLAALIVFFKVIPGDQPDKFLEEKVKPVFDKFLSFYGLISKKKPEA